MNVLHFVTTAAAAFCMSIAIPASAQADADHAYGPVPEWTSFREIAEKAISARLVDPESARITWLSGFRKGGFKPLLERRVFGYVACGEVNARNRMGGYVGATTFIAVVDNGRAVFADADRRSGGMYATMCAKEIAEGRFPTVPAEAPSTGSDALPVASPAGLIVRAMPDGAYVSAVTAGSAAAVAGLSPGMVITAINGLSLAGMDEAMIKVVAAAGAGASLTIAGGKTITLAAPK